MGPMGPRGLGPIKQSCLKKPCVWKKSGFLTFPVTVMVLLKMGPMGPRGLGPNPFSTVSPCPPGVFFGKRGVPNKKNRISKKMGVF